MLNQGSARNRGEILVGRTEELRRVALALLAKPELVRPVVVTGPPGIGKTALVRAFARENVGVFPGGYVHLSAAEIPADDRAFISVLTDKLGLRASAGDPFGVELGGALRRGAVEESAESIRERLLSPATLLQIDDIDTREATVAVTRLVRQLRGCPIALTGRVEALGVGQDWEIIRLGALDEGAAEELLSLVLTTTANEAEKAERKALIAATGGSPLALRLIAGLLHEGTPASALRMMVEGHQSGEDQPPSSGSKFRRTLALSIERALARLQEKLGEGAASLVDALRYLAHGPPSGVGVKLGAALLGISEADFSRLMEHAEQIRIVEVIPGIVPGGAPRWGMHPAIAEVLQRPGEKDVALGRMTAWFVERFPGTDAGVAEIEDEVDALSWWLGAAPESEWPTIAEAGENFAHVHGPYQAWETFCDRALPKAQDDEQRFSVLRIAASVALHRAELISAYSAAEELLHIAERRGDPRTLMLAWKVVADVLAAQGQTGESARILQEEVLGRLDKERDRDEHMVIFVALSALLEREGHYESALRMREELAKYFAQTRNARSYAIMVGETAAIHQRLGRFDEALRLLEIAIPTLESVGDKQALAFAWAIRGDALLGQGRADEALGIYRDRVLPTQKMRGDRPAMAYTSSRIARALEQLSRHQEALQIRTSEVIPVIDALGDERAIADEKFAYARNLEAQKQFVDALPIYTDEVEPVLVRFADHGALAKVRYVIAHLHLKMDNPEAARAIVRDQLIPYFEQANDHRSRAIAFSILADAQASLGDLDACAQTYSAEAWPSVERTNDAKEQGVVLANWGVALARSGDYDLGIEKLHRALALFEGTGLTENVVAQAWLGRALRRRNRPGDREDAQREITKALAEAERTSHAKTNVIRRLHRHPTLERIEIKNFKAIQHLFIDFSRPQEPSALPGQWTCIFGANGAGKSGILQAIALVLLGDELARDVGSGWLERMRRREGDRIHDAEIRATVRFADERRDLFIHISEKGIDDAKTRVEPGFDEMRAFWDERKKEHVLLAYGPGRNLSERVGQDSREDEEVRRQLTLFDPLMQVASADALLRDHEHAKRIFPLFRKLLAQILKDTPITLDPDRSSIRFRVGSARVNPVDLPDGFRATIAWLADLCAVWVKKAPEESESGDPSTIRGLVLLDEIDLHLHPGLQRVLVPRLRLALPEVQWLVTSHSPLVLGSFDKTEIVPVEMDPVKGVRQGEKLDRQILGFTADQVYDFLMHVKPRSEAIEAHFGDSPEDRARQNLILAQSPSTSEEEALANREYRRKLAAERRGKSEDSSKKPA